VLAFVHAAVLGPLRAAGVIGAEEAADVGERTARKVVLAHAGAPNADFLLREEGAVRRLAAELIEHGRKQLAAELIEHGRRGGGRPRPPRGGGDAAAPSGAGGGG